MQSNEIKSARPVQLFEDVGYQCVADFGDDGPCYLAFDARLPWAENRALAATIRAVGKRRLRAGLSDEMRVRCRLPHDNIFVQTATADVAKAA